MSTSVQFRRGTTSEHSSFTGAVGEVTVDTDKDVIVVHDGSTAGGFPAAGANSRNTFTKGQVGNISTLTDGATITPNLSTANNFKVTLGGNRTIANPSNIAAGQSGQIEVIQDGTGGRTLSWGSYWNFNGGTAPTLSTAAGAKDLVCYYCASTTSIHAAVITDLQ